MPLKQIARKAGVSAGLVSMILHGKGRASQAVRSEVLDLLTEAGYQPRLRVRPVLLMLDMEQITASGKSQNILQQVQGLQEALAAEGVALQIETVSDPASRSGREHVHAIVGRKPGGVVVPTDMPGLEGTLETFAESGLAVVQMGYDTEDPRWPAAVVDSFAGMYSAVRMLLEQGHRRIGTLRWQAGLASVNSNKKHAGFLAALADAQVEPEPLDVQIISAAQDEPGWRSGLEPVEAMLDQPDPPTALVVENSFISLPLLYPSSGRPVPEAVRELDIVHFEDWPLGPVEDIFCGKLNSPPLETTLIRIAWGQVGRMAAGLMVQALRATDNQEQPTVLRISPQIEKVRGMERIGYHKGPVKEGSK